MRGKRKNNCGRYLGADVWRSAPNETYSPSSSDNDDGSEENSGSTNVERYGNRIEGPWVVGICECSVDEEGKRKLLESRFFIVERRDKP